MYNTQDGLLYIPAQNTRELICAFPKGTGDANGDGVVDLCDVLTAASALAGRTEWSMAGFYAADLNGSGEVEQDDLDALVQKLLQ